MEAEEHSEQDDNNDEEEEEEEEDVDEERERISNKKSQSPWDFAKYTESVAEEHGRRSTTSVDHKIEKAIKQHVHIVNEYFLRLMTKY